MATSVPPMLPMLARGKHRNPRRGACFMELASFLAGERWSDRPACTHPLLAHLARLVNDLTSDAARPRLAVMVPSVIGLNSDEPHWWDEITIVAAHHALPVVAEASQRALAVGLLTCERQRAQRADAALPGMHPMTVEALAMVPMAHRWADSFIGQMGVPGHQHPGSHVLECAALGISAALTPDPDAQLYDLLATVIDHSRRLAGKSEDLPPLPSSWQEVCQPA